MRQVINLNFTPQLQKRCIDNIEGWYEEDGRFVNTRPWSKLVSGVLSLRNIFGNFHYSIFNIKWHGYEAIK